VAVVFGHLRPLFVAIPRKNIRGGGDIVLRSGRVEKFLGFQRSSKEFCRNGKFKFCQPDRNAKIALITTVNDTVMKRRTTIKQNIIQGIVRYGT